MTSFRSASLSSRSPTSFDAAASERSTASLPQLADRAVPLGARFPAARARAARPAPPSSARTAAARSRSDCDLRLGQQRGGLPAAIGQRLLVLLHQPLRLFLQARRLRDLVRQPLLPRLHRPRIWGQAYFFSRNSRTRKTSPGPEEQAEVHLEGTDRRPGRRLRAAAVPARWQYHGSYEQLEEEREHQRDDRGALEQHGEQQRRAADLAGGLRLPRDASATEPPIRPRPMPAPRMASPMPMPAPSSELLFLATADAAGAASWSSASMFSMCVTSLLSLGDELSVSLPVRTPRLPRAASP